MDRSNGITGFLRTRRAAITPEQAGLPPDGRVRHLQRPHRTTLAVPADNPGAQQEAGARPTGMPRTSRTRLLQEVLVFTLMCLSAGVVPLLGFLCFTR